MDDYGAQAKALQTVIDFAEKINAKAEKRRRESIERLIKHADSLVR